MCRMDRIEQRLRRLAIALERVDSAWRREHSLTVNEKLVITFLAADGVLAPSELSRLVGLTTAGVTTLLDRLEDSGYVERRRNPDDGRRVLVTPTKKAIMARLCFEAVNVEIARTVSEADAASIERFLETAEEIALRRVAHGCELGATGRKVPE